MKTVEGEGVPAGRSGVRVQAAHVRGSTSLRSLRDASCGPSPPHSWPFLAGAAIFISGMENFWDYPP